MITPTHHQSFLTRLCALTALLLCLCVGSKVTAQEQDPDRLKVYAKSLFGHDDNTMYTQNGSQDTFAAYVLGIDLEKDFLRNFTAELGGEVAHLDYDTIDERDDTQYDVHSALETRFGDYANLRVEGMFYSAIAPVDAATSEAVEQTTHSGTAIASLYPHDRWGVDLAYGVEDTTYRDRRLDSLEHQQTTYWFSGYYLVSTKTRIGLKYTGGEHNYDEDFRPDADLTRISGFLKYQMTGKLNSHWETGVEYLEYDDNTNGYDAGEVSGSPYVNCLLTYRPDAYWQLDAGVKRQAYSTSNVNSNYRIDLTGLLLASYKSTDELTLTAGATYTDSEQHNTFDSDRWTASLEILYEITSWMGLELTYEHEHYDTKRPNNDYRRNVGTAGVVISY